MSPSASSVGLKREGRLPNGHERFHVRDALTFEEQLEHGLSAAV
jgi:hypothetical protein